jgi:Caspase domain
MADTTNRYALIIATSEYEDPDLKKLFAPGKDANDLSLVLKDPDIGQFKEVTIIKDQHSYKVGEEIQAFVSDRRRDDLLLLYFSCHGMKDEDGRLYYAAVNTRRKLLAATAISANFVNELMAHSRSRCQLLIIDCCYSGAFSKGLGTKADKEVNTGVYFEQGRGRIVLTASDAMQYSFEEGNLTVEVKDPGSIFTRAIVEGLKTGKADYNHDGVISYSELYDYAYDRVKNETPNQRPEKWEFGVEGDVIVAKNPVKFVIRKEDVASTISLMSTHNDPRLSGNRVAIIVGVNNYQDGNTHPLRGAENDAREMYERLRNPNIGNFDIPNNFFLRGEDATYENIRRAINCIFWKTEQYYDLVLLYFSGQTLVDEYNEAYLITYDMQLYEPLIFGINVRELVHTISKSNNIKNIIMIIDCSQIITDTSRFRNKGNIRTPIDFKDHFSVDKEREGAVVTLVSEYQRTDPESKEALLKHANDTQPHPHGILTFHLLEGIDGQAATHPNGIITFEQLVAYLTKEMNKSSVRLKYSVSGMRGDQIQLAIFPRKWLDWRHQLMSEINESGRNREQVFALYNAAKKLNELLEMEPENRQIIDFKNVITDSLQSYKGRIYGWLDENAIYVQPKINTISPDLFSSLYKFENTLSSEDLIKMDSIEVTRLSALIDVINGKTPTDVFIGRIAYANKQQRMQSNFS